MSGAASADVRMRIGEVAERTGCTTRSIRYWEEVGLLPAGSQPEKGRHRTYDADDVDRIRALVRTRDLLGINLDELRVAYETELQRSRLRERWHEGGLGEDEQVVLLEEAVGHIDVQLAMVRDRIAHLEEFERELLERRASVRRKLASVTPRRP